MASSKTMVVLMILLALLEVEAMPRCRNYEEERILCTAGNIDYELQEGFVSGDEATKSITLRECRLTGLEQNSFKDLPALEYLDLSGNKLRDIEENSLDGLNKLIHLNLSYNMLTEINNTFSKASNIEVLDLRGNELEIIRTGILKKLIYLDLSYNLLNGKALVDIFEENTNIRYLDLSGNDLHVMLADGFFNWAQNLEDLRLDGCSLKYIPNLRKHNLETIKYLSLSANNLKSISNVETFIFLKKMETLNLAENEIDSIAERAFLLTTNLKTIILRNNKLDEIPEALFQTLPNLNNVDLSNNLLEDLPEDTFRSTPVKNLNLAGNRFTYLPSNFLLELRNILVNIETFYFHHNPWQCPCLIDIIEEVKKFKIEYNSERYNGVDPVCVTGEQFKCERDSLSTQEYTELYDKAIKDHFKSQGQ